MARGKAYERLVRKLTVEVLWLYVARVLMGSEPLKAYEIRKRIAETFGIKPRTITTYSVVYRMSREGLLKPLRLDGDVVYALTEEGAKEFGEAVKFLERVLEYLKG